MGRGFKLGESQQKREGGKSAALIQRVSMIDANGLAVPATLDGADSSVPDWDGSLYIRKASLTQDGDLLVRKSGVLTRLPIGVANQVLTVVNGVAAWATGGGGGMANPMTTLGDIITGGVAGAAQRLGIGTAGQVLSVVGGVPAWAAASGGASTSMAALVAADGAAGYWKLTEAAGTSLADSSGNGLTGTAHGGVTVGAAGPWTKAVTLNGTTGYIDFGAVPKDGVNAQDEATFEFWLKPAAATFVGLLDTSPGAGGTLRNYNTGQWEKQGGTNLAISNFSTVAWTHFAIVVGRSASGAAAKVFINGVLSNSGTGWWGFGWAAGWVLGNINAGGAGWFSGSIAHFAYYNRALPASRILAHAGATSD